MSSDASPFPKTVRYTKPYHRFWGALLLVLVDTALIVGWSGGFIGVRFASGHAPIITILFWRSLVSAAVLFPFALMSGPRIRRSDFLVQLLFGALSMFCYLGGFSLAIALGVPTGLTALITDLLPLVSWPILGQRLSRRQWVGSAIGVVGVLIASGWSVHSGCAALWAYALPLAGTCALAIATVLQQRLTAGKVPVQQSLCIQCSSAAILFGCVAWWQGNAAPPLDLAFIGGIAWLVFIATLLTWSLYYFALKQSSATTVTMILYLSPPLTMVWAWAMFSEPLSWMLALGFAVSLGGIVFATLRSSN